MKGYAVPVICSPLANQRVDVAEKLFPILKDLDLSDGKRGPHEIDLLIGVDYYWTIIEGEIRRCNDEGLTAINSKLGWLLSGPFNEEEKNIEVELDKSHVMKVEVLVDTDDNKLENLVEKFWNLDTLGFSKVEPAVYDKFMVSVRFINGRYEVSLPFGENRPFIEDNYNLSEKRLISLKNKLDKDENLLKIYDEVIKEQLESGVVESANCEPTVGGVTYIPHRAVIRSDRKTTKVRIVFDASAKNKGNSLNECLMKGPCLTPLLFDVFLWFRAGNIGLIADIEKAYLQISVKPKERDYLRFLWYDDIEKETHEDNEI